MPDTGSFEQFRGKLIGTISQQRFVLLVAGALTCLLGVAAIAVPLYVAQSVLWLVGGLFFASAVIKMVQWVVGRCRHGHQVQGFAAIAFQAAVDLFVGALLIFKDSFSLVVLSVFIGLVFFADGVTQVLIGLQVANLRHRIVLLASGGATCVIAVLAGVFSFSDDPVMMDVLSCVVGGKLVLFGGVLVYMAASAREDHVTHVYGAPALREVPKIPGEAYAVYIGNAFHLGVYVGDNEVVDFRDTNLVYLVTWEQFLIGRQPQHWEYPDLPKVLPEEVCAFARNQVGQTHQYNFFKFNCEHFAVWCKSLGRVKNSKYCQVAVGIETMSDYPMFGAAVEIYSRATEWLAFKAGGTFGKKAALKIRQVSSLVAKWMLTSRLKKHEYTDPAGGPVVIADTTEGKNPKSEEANTKEIPNTNP